MKRISLYAFTALSVIVFYSCKKKTNQSIDMAVGTYTGMQHNAASNIHGANPYCYDTTYSTKVSVQKISADSILIGQMRLRYSDSIAVAAPGELTIVVFLRSSGSMKYSYTWSDPGGTAVTNVLSTFSGVK